MSSVVPEGWSKVKIGSLISEISEKTICSNQHEVLSVTKDGITPQRGYFNKQIASEDNTGYKILRKGNLVFGTMNLWMGSLDVLKKPSIGIVSPAYKTFRFNTEKCGVDFMSNFMRTPYMVHKYVLHSQQGASIVRRNLNLDQLLVDEVVIPPLPEQKKIASILTSVDEVIENTQKQIDKLQDLKKATMNELLTKGIGHTEFKDSELGRIPKSWEVVRFQEVFESYTYGPRFSSKDYSPIGNVKTIRGTDLTKDWCINYKQVPLAELDEKVVLQHRLKENDVVMITTADCGFSAVFKEQSIPFIASAYAIRLRPTLRINSSFCVCYLQTSIAKNQIEKYERKGTVSNLPGSDVMNVRLPLPSLDEQSEIVSALTSIDTNISNNLEKLSQTQSLKKSLMQDLLTGKVRVTVN
jgi:restriction endonuclease S subunit